MSVESANQPMKRLFVQCTRLSEGSKPRRGRSRILSGWSGFAPGALFPSDSPKTCRELDLEEMLNSLVKCEGVRKGHPSGRMDKMIL